MIERDYFEQAIIKNYLLKIRYSNKSHSIHNGVIRPLRIIDSTVNENNKKTPCKLVAYSYETNSERILTMSRITELIPFEPILVDNINSVKITHFRDKILHCIVPLFHKGWLLNSDEDYLGIYPRSSDDTVETSKGYAYQHCCIQYLKSPRHSFHLWFKDGGYWRYDAFDDALDHLMCYALEQPTDMATELET